MTAPLHRLSPLAFVLLYLLLDWLSYTDPLYGLNITPWSPDPALGLLFWLRHGRLAALPWFVALVAGEYLVRGMPAGLALTLLSSAWLTLAYGLIGEVLRRSFCSSRPFSTGPALLRWLVVVAVGSFANGAVYVALLDLGGLVPPGAWRHAAWRFGIGDSVGVLVAMPLLWMLAGAASRARFLATVWESRARLETVGYLLLALAVLWMVFYAPAGEELAHFYFLFLPVIWAASRQGTQGAALIVFALQLAIVALRKWHDPGTMSVFEWQMLDAVLALVGFFIGIAVDERRQVADELKQTLRMAAAGDMAAALAHELNQPVTALGAYGKACQHLLDHGGAAQHGTLLRTTIGRMIDESNRAADVVRRLRDFFRSGATQLERLTFDAVAGTIVQQFRLPFHEHGVRFEQHIDPGLALEADRVQIELVLRNLLANALDAVRERPEGQRSVTLAACRGAPGLLRISVTDSGTGMSRAVAARLFEPFATTKAAGMGLGLALSRAIVEAHGGTLWAEAGEHGALHFTLPADAGGSHGG